LISVAALWLALLMPAGAGDPTARDGFLETLNALAPEVSARELDERATRLAGLPDATGTWLEIESTGLPGAGPDGGNEPPAGVQSELLDRVAAKLPRESVIEAVHDASPSHADPAWRTAAIALLRKHATSEELPLLVDLVRAKDGGIAADDPLVASLEAALVDVARRDVRLIGRSGWFTENAKALEPTFLRVLGATGDPDALPPLAKALQRQDLALVAVRQVARLAGKAAPGFRADLAARVRPLLEWSDDTTRRHAVRALVALEDEASIPVLLKIVENEATGRHEPELAALAELSGRKPSQDLARWRRWYDEERKWVERDSAAALERLASKDDAVVVAAIRELADHGLGRARSAEGVADVLRTHGSAAVRNQACLALGRLRSRAGVDALVAGLADSDPAVAGSALRALDAITGLALPLDAKVWRDALRTGS
jgi:HEAT repeat protein